MNYPYCDDSVMYGKMHAGRSGKAPVRRGADGGMRLRPAALLRPAAVCGALLLGAGATGAQDAARAQMMQQYLQQQSTGSSSQMQDLMRKYRAGELEGQDGTRPESAETGTVRVTVEVRDRSRTIKPGMFGRIQVQYDQRDDALLVPKNALVEEDNAVLVFVVDDSVARQRAVTTGYSSGDRIEIRDGLAEGDRVVLSGQTALRDSARVEIVQ